MRLWTWARSLAAPRRGGWQRRRSRPRPAAVHRFCIPSAVLQATGEVMQSHGRCRRECYVWWGGYHTRDGEAQVLTAYYPKVAAGPATVHLTTSDLLQLHQQLRDHDQTLIAELHTHPGRGGQNSTDAANPAAVYAGFLSIVVPDYSFPTLDLVQSHVYEYLSGGAWREWASTEKSGRLVVEPSCVHTGDSR